VQLLITLYMYLLNHMFDNSFLLTLTLFVLRL